MRTLLGEGHPEFQFDQDCLRSWLSQERDLVLPEEVLTSSIQIDPFPDYSNPIFNSHRQLARITERKMDTLLDNIKREYDIQ